MKLFNYAIRRGLGSIDQPLRHAKVEFGAPGVAEKVAEIEALLEQKIAELDALPNDAELEKAEPDDLAAVKALRPPGDAAF